jgi:hypothetical protein
MKIAVIARCKNEIENLEAWINNKRFCDILFITDNESTDGSYEFLSKQSNVVVTKVVGFDEGRDFQILLKKARAHNVDWVFKFDCDEFVDENFDKQLNYIINNTKFDCILLRKIAKHFTVPQNKCFIGSEYYNGLVYGVRLSQRINIRNKIIHVGSFRFFKNPVIIESLISHYWIRSVEDATERAKTYSKIDKNKNYIIKDKVPLDKTVEIASANSQMYKKYDNYGIPFLFKISEKYVIKKPKFNKVFIKNILKLSLWPLLHRFELLLNYMKKK